MTSWLSRSSPALHLGTLLRAMGLLVLVRSLKLGLMHIDYIAHTQILFDYWGWGWLPKPDALGAQLLLASSAAGGAAMLLGRGRIAAMGLGVASFAFTYVFLLDKAFFGSLNWAIVSMLVVLLLTRAWRIDKRSPEATRLEAIAPKVLLAIMYFYAGLIKLSSDWLSGDVIAAFFQASSAPPDLLLEPAVLSSLAVLGAAFDLCIGPLLLVQKTRRFGLLAALLFHGTNLFLLDVPEVALGMLLLTLAIFAPRSIHEKLNKIREIQPKQETETSPTGLSTARAFMLCVFLLCHLAIPLRPYIEPGDSRWTHHAQDFSWWLRSTHINCEFEAFVTLDEQAPIKIDVPGYIDVDNQSHFALDPALITQFAHHVARDYARRHPEITRVRITVESRAQLNRRPWQRFIRPGLDLAAEPLRYDMSHLVVPLGETP